MEHGVVTIIQSLSNSALESLAKYAEHLKNDSDKALNTKYCAEVRFFGH